MDERKAVRLMRLLRSLGKRADGMVITGAAETGYAPVAEMFNDYVRQARELFADELINAPRELDPDAEGAEAFRAMAQLAVEAGQLSEELELLLIERDIENVTEDWADALVRLAEADIDVSEVAEYLEDQLDARGHVRRNWVDRLVKLAEAGVDLDEVLEHTGSWMEASELPERPSRRSHRRTRHARHAVPGASPRPGPRHRLESPAPIPWQNPGDDDGTAQVAWQMEILSRVEKGDLTPEEGASLLERGTPGDS